MSGDSQPGSKENRIESLLRPLLIAGMMTCIVASLIGLLKRFAPAWAGEYITLLSFFVCLEGIFSERLIRERGIRGRSKIEFRLIEWVVVMITLRIVLALTGDLHYLPYLLRLWLRDPRALFDPGYIVTAMVLFLVWLTSITLTEDLLALDIHPQEVTSPPTTSKEYWLWVSRPRGRSNSAAALSRIVSLFFWGGMILLIFAGLTRIDIERFLGMRHPPTPGVILNALIYFLLGLALVSHAYFTTMYSRWRLQRIEVAQNLGKRWITLAVAFVGIVMFLALLLPTHYSTGLLESLFTVVNWILLWIMRILTVIFGLLMLIMNWILQHLFGMDSTWGGYGRIPRFRLAPSPPIATQGLPWWESLRSLLFWFTILSIVGYSLHHFLRQRTDLLRWLASLPLFRWILAILHALWQGSETLIKKTGERLQQRFRRIKGVGVQRITWRYLSLRSLSPVQLVRYFYLSTLQRAEKAQQGRAPHQTPYEYEISLATRMPEARADVHQLTGAFVEARYSRRVFTSEEIEPLKQSWRRIRAALRTLLRREREENAD